MWQPFVFICIISLLYADYIFRRKIFEVPYVREIALHLPFQHSGGLDKDVFWKLAIEQAEVTNGVTNLVLQCCQ